CREQGRRRKFIVDEDPCEVGFVVKDEEDRAKRRFFKLAVIEPDLARRCGSEAAKCQLEIAFVLEDLGTRGIDRVDALAAVDGCAVGLESGEHPNGKGLVGVKANVLVESR